MLKIGATLCPDGKNAMFTLIESKYAGKEFFPSPTAMHLAACSWFSHACSVNGAPTEFRLTKFGIKHDNPSIVKEYSYVREEKAPVHLLLPDATRNQCVFPAEWWPHIKDMVREYNVQRLALEVAEQKRKDELKTVKVFPPRKGSSFSTWWYTYVKEAYPTEEYTSYSGTEPWEWKAWR